MTLGNTPRTEVNFALEASKSFSFGITFTNLDGSPFDLGTAILRLVAVEPSHLGGSEALNNEALFTDSSNGFAQFNFQAEDLALEPGSYGYDVTYVPLDGYSIPILKGSIELGPNTDLDTSNVYLTTHYVSDVTVVLDHGDVIKVTVERKVME